MVMTEISDFRKAKDQYFGGDQNSPLTVDQRKRFQGLQYFAENSNLRFVLAVEEFPTDSKWPPARETRRPTRVGASLSLRWTGPRWP
jgi:uncharacterized protein (DUF1684 family)